jgi:hypothetical protein
MDLTEIGRGCGLDSSGFGYGQVVCRFEHGNVLSGSIRCWEYPEWLLKNGSTLLN